MAEKRAIVLYNGKTEELRTGDTLYGSGGGGGGGGSFTIKRVAITFDSPNYQQEFEIDDAEITDTTLIVASVAYNPGEDPESWQNQSIIVRCGNASSGSFTMYVSSVGEQLYGTYHINYIIPNSGSSASIKQVSFSYDDKYVILDVADSSATSSSLVIASFAQIPDVDPPEWWTNNMIVRCGNARAGYFTMYICTTDGSNPRNSFHINYIIS